MQVREMKAGDLSAIAQLSAELGYPVEASDLRSRFEALERDQSGALLVAEVSPGQIAGWIHVGGEWTLTSGALAEIRGLVVARGHRRKGAGRKLVTGAEEWSRRQGYRSIRVRTRIARQDAHSFYRACGYELEKTQHVFSRELTDAAG
ncbi:MAG TPA: GNAT family N-acetyltransferase [Thermoanaerobaculia bacterium]|nr:GNAT family N-acetyltransferase [Thermoanaerobaculia bacterium]